MYVRSELDDDYYDFLVHEVRPALKRCNSTMSHEDSDLKRGVLEMMGIGVVEIIPSSRFLERRFVSVDSCGEYEIHEAVCQIRHAVNDYISDFHERKHAQEIKEREKLQGRFEFSPGAYCGDKKMRGNLTFRDAFKR
ncbi:MAG: hypothetical protein KC506_02990 [Nanoarchaeota archaeon]|nr:hypothetical protein [Nanoarchaeota archaeon]